MAAKRRWTQWPGRAAQELNGVSGIAGLGGTVLGAGGLTLLTGAAALTLTGVGAIVVAGAVGYAVYKAIPPALQRAEDFVGKTVLPEALANVFPPIKSVAVIGITQAGKTTLRGRLGFDRKAPSRTQAITAYVVSLQTSPTRYLAILDGSGDRYAQQFRIAEKCDHLCIVVDHNISDTASAVDPTRIAEHKSFLGQVRHFLDESHAETKDWIQILLNKHDLWGSLLSAEQSALMKLFADEAQVWKQGRYAKSVEFYPHTNAQPDDVARFMDQLKQ